MFWEFFNCYKFRTTGLIQVRFHQNVPLVMRTSIRENWKCHMFDFRLIPLYHTTYVAQPNQTEWVVCREYWFLDASSYCMQLLLYLIPLSCQQFNITKSCINTGGSSFWKLYVSIIYRVSTSDWYRVWKNINNIKPRVILILIYAIYYWKMSATFSINFTKKWVFVSVCYDIIEI